MLELAAARALLCSLGFSVLSGGCDGGCDGGCCCCGCSGDGCGGGGSGGGGSGGGGGFDGGCGGAGFERARALTGASAIPVEPVPTPKMLRLLKILAVL